MGKRNIVNLLEFDELRKGNLARVAAVFGQNYSGCFDHWNHLGRIIFNQTSHFLGACCRVGRWVHNTFAFGGDGSCFRLIHLVFHKWCKSDSTRRDALLRLVKPADFFREVSQNARLKFTLTWLAFGGLVVPTALAITAGAAEQYALPFMLAAILPFQYVSFCVMEHLKERHRQLPNHIAGESLLSLYDTTIICVSPSSVAKVSIPHLDINEFPERDSDESLPSHSSFAEILVGKVQARKTFIRAEGVPV